LLGASGPSLSSLSSETSASSPATLPLVNSQHSFHPARPHSLAPVTLDPAPPPSPLTSGKQMLQHSALLLMLSAATSTPSSTPMSMQAPPVISSLLSSLLLMVSAPARLVSTSRLDGHPLVPATALPAPVQPSRRPPLLASSRRPVASPSCSHSWMTTGRSQVHSDVSRAGELSTSSTKPYLSV